MYPTIDVAVIGAGAAGMMAAASAGQRGRSVVLIDHAQKLAEKIRISGGGRCNFTNLYASAGNYLSQNPHFCKSALAQYGVRDFLDLIERHGIAYHEKKLGQLFCNEGSAAIIRMLQSECDAAGVQWRLGCTVHTVQYDGASFLIDTAHGQWRSQSLVVACGGLSIPQIGATGLGYDIARQFGHDITPLKAGLVPLTFQPEDLLPELAGIALPAEVSCGKARFRDDLLFTHKGVSGPAILQISSYWQPGEAISLNLLPELDADAWLEMHASSNQQVATVLSERLPARLAKALTERHNLALAMKQTTPAQRRRLASDLQAWKIIPSGTVGYKKAEVTCGGVDTRAVSSKTLMSQLCKNLFFAGEVLDVTGWLGGYNFQWAWASGYVAGQFA